MGSRSIHNISKKEVRRFLDSHPDKAISPAKFEYSLYLEPQTQKIVDDYIEKKLVKSEEDSIYEKLIAETTDPEELLRLMRKKISGLNRSALRKKVLENEEAMLPLIKEKALRIRQDIFIENALYFFLHSKVNHCEWIVREYENFSSEYLKSMLCLVLGFRGEVGLIPFLMKETERFEREYPWESFDQGPILAVQELAVRFLN